MSTSETIAETRSNKLGITEEEDTESWNTSTVTILVDTSTGVTMYVPIPNGYVASSATGESTVADGLVIYEGTEEVTDDNVAEAKTTRNQYVWIPCDPSEIYWTSTSNGKKYGIYYTFSSTGVSSTKGSREPIIASSSTYYYEDYYQDKYYSNIESEEELLEDMQMDFEEMVASIEKYGGYYIGRYEIGDNDVTSRSSSTKFKDTPVVMQGKYPYNYITWYQAYDLSKELSGDSENVTTTMIWGCLWDNTLNYLVTSGNKTYAEIVSSTSWGNYYDATFTYTNISGSSATNSSSGSVIIPTGSTEYTNALNIYDLAGNIWEWTLEANSSSYYSRYNRGGCYGYSGADGPSSYRRNNDPNNSDNSIGARAVLYIE